MNTPISLGVPNILNPPQGLAPSPAVPAGACMPSPPHPFPGRSESQAASSVSCLLAAVATEMCASSVSACVLPTFGEWCDVID